VLFSFNNASDAFNRVIELTNPRSLSM
jgi:hypothetical protein